MLFRPLCQSSRRFVETPELRLVTDKFPSCLDECISLARLHFVWNLETCLSVSSNQFYFELFPTTILSLYLPKRQIRWSVDHTAVPHTSKSNLNTTFQSFFSPNTAAWLSHLFLNMHLTFSAFKSTPASQMYAAEQSHIWKVMKQHVRIMTSRQVD